MDLYPKDTVPNRTGINKASIIPKKQRSVALLPVGNYRSFQQLVNINHSLATKRKRPLDQGPALVSAPFLRDLSLSQLQLTETLTVFAL